MSDLTNAIVVFGTVEQAEVLDEEELKRIMASRVATTVSEPKRSEDGVVLN